MLIHSWIHAHSMPWGVLSTWKSVPVLLKLLIWVADCFTMTYCVLLHTGLQSKSLRWSVVVFVRFFGLLLCSEMNFVCFDFLHMWDELIWGKKLENGTGCKMGGDFSAPFLWCCTVSASRHQHLTDFPWGNWFGLSTVHYYYLCQCQFLHQNFLQYFAALPHSRRARQPNRKRHL